MRSIDADPFGPTIEEKIFRGGKRIAVVFAVAAVGISTLDLVNTGSVERAAEFIHDSRVHYAELPDRILAGIHQISVLPTEPSVILKIPRHAVARVPSIGHAPNLATLPENAPKLAARAPAQRTDVAPAVAPKLIAAPIKSVAKSGLSPVDELADVRNLDAVEFAMAGSPVPQTLQTAAFALASPGQAAPAPPAAAPLSDQIKLASLDAGALSANLANPVPVPMAAPIPLAMVPMPIPAPGVPPPSPAQRLKLEGKEYAKAERCLANAVYWEARSEPVRGQMAVAQVVMNRVFSGFYPNDVCSVVYQNANRHLSCQFTFACDGKRKVINERGAWARANRIAKQTLDGQIYVPEVAKSTHYHAIYVHPYWAHEMRKLVRYGIHNFYRPYAWGNGAEEPVWGRAALASNKKR